MLDVTLPLRTQAGRVEIGDRWWPIPGYAEFERWAEDLLAAGTLVIDEDVRTALGGGHLRATDRTVQRRYRRAVGLTAGQVAQLRRAERAYALLQAGRRPAEASSEAGFADQAHLTRAMRLIRGRTPAAILADERAARTTPDA